MSDGFRDHFGPVAEAYRTARPDYPQALYEWLFGQCGGDDRAWDCATGSGQVALALAERFDVVVATDRSRGQLRGRRNHDRIRYAVASAESVPLRDASVDLVTVGQALHWFDRAAFFKEVERVLRPNGVLAVWTYGRATAGEDVDASLAWFHDVYLAPWWPWERSLVMSGYAGVTMPFEPLSPPSLFMERDWTLDELLAYVGTWSAVGQAAAAGEDSVERLRALLAPHWHERRRVRWPLTVRATRRP